MDQEARNLMVGFQIQQNLLLNGRKPLEQEDLDKMVRKMNFRVAIVGLMFRAINLGLLVVGGMVLAGLLGLPTLKVVLAGILLKYMFFGDTWQLDVARNKLQAINTTLVEAIQLSKPGNPPQTPPPNTGAQA